MEIIISGKDKKLLQEVEALAKQLGLQVKQPIMEAKVSQANNLYELMEEAAEDGGLFQSIENPSQWQRKQREDSALPKE